MNSSQHISERDRLTPEERARMRHVLTSYMAMKPLRIHVAPSRIRWTAISIWNMRAVAFSLIAALFVSSAGISYAAEGALPGDLLYAVKTGVNEPVREALALSDEAQARVQASIATARLDETQKLAAAGRLDSATESELQSSFEAHAAKANEASGKFAARDPAAALEISSSLSAHIAANADILGALNGSGEERTGKIAAAAPAPAVTLAVRSAASKTMAREQEVSTMHVASDIAEPPQPAPIIPSEDAGTHVNVQEMGARQVAAENTIVPEPASTTFADTSPLMALAAKAESRAQAATRATASAFAAYGTTTFTTQASAAAQLAVERLTDGKNALEQPAPSAGGEMDAYTAFMDSLNASARAQAFVEAAGSSGRPAGSGAHLDQDTNSQPTSHGESGDIRLDTGL